jgi:hypothetical protein
MHVRSAQVELDFFDHQTKKHRFLTVWAVLAEEKHTTPRGEKPIQWLLLSNQSAETADQARSFLNVYTLRWQIEEFHKTWKSGYCGVEDMQLRTANAAKIWATILATVATRVERLKHLAREEPQKPASIELSSVEIRALKLLKTRQKSRVEVIPKGMPTIKLAVRWLADLGGYTRPSDGSAPGSITIGRGLAQLATAVEVLEAFRQARMKQ